MERKTKTKKWTRETKQNMEFLVKEALVKGATVTVKPHTRTTKHDTYTITETLLEPDSEFIPKLKDEILNMDKLILKCRSNNSDFEENIEYIRSNIETNNCLIESYHDRILTARVLLQKMSRETVEP